MNHFAHAWIASHVRNEPHFVLGAMLPDLTGFLRIPTPEIRSAQVSAGIALHHATDRAFHAQPAFQAATRAGFEALLESGLARGPARASAHVAIELLLDALLARDWPDTLGPYRAGLMAAASLDWRSRGDCERVEGMARRLACIDPATALQSTEALVEPVRRTLAPRRRLALAPADLPALANWLGSLRRTLDPEASRLADDTLRAVRPQDS